MLKKVLVTIGIIIIALLVIVLMFGVQPQIYCCLYAKGGEGEV